MFQNVSKSIDFRDTGMKIIFIHIVDDETI